MSKFGPSSGNDKSGNLPPGINMAYTSFSYQNQQGTYNPTFQSQNQPKIETATQHQKGKPGGGWGDDDDDQSQLNKGNNSSGTTKQTFMPTTNINTTTQNISTSSTNTGGSGGAFSFLNKTKVDTKSSDFEVIPVDEKFLQDREYEHKLILDTIQPSGARLKQADTVLNTFVKAAETLNVPTVASIIISKLRSDLIFVSKARALYNLELLVKKLGKYFEFFKWNLPTLKGLDFALTEGNSSNVSQLNSLLQSIIKFIEDPQGATSKPTVQNQPYTPNIQNDAANLLDLSEPEPQKKSDAFNFIKSNQGTATTKSPTDSSPKKNNAFGFINKNPTQEVNSSAQAQNQNQQKSNAFGFIKSSEQQSQNTQPVQLQQPTKAPNQNRYEFLEMESTENSSKPQDTGFKTDITNSYGTSGGQSSNGFGKLNNIDFSGMSQNQNQNQQQFNQQGGYGSFGGNLNTGFNQNYGGNFGVSSPNYNSGGYNQNAGISFNPNYQTTNSQFNGMNNQFGNMNLGLNLDTEEEKKKKQQQEQEDKFFNFVKF